MLFLLSRLTAVCSFDVHRASTAWTSALIRVAVEELDGVLAPVAREVAVVAVDHRQARAHVTEKVERGDPSTEREGRERVPEIVNPARRLDRSGVLGRLPVPVAEVVEVKRAPSEAANTRPPRPSMGRASSAASARACSGTARMLASVFGYLTRPFR